MIKNQDPILLEERIGHNIGSKMLGIRHGVEATALSAAGQI